MWKVDWTDYDRRASHRLCQQKQAERARKRKKQARRHNKRNNTNRFTPTRNPHSETDCMPSSSSSNFKNCHSINRRPVNVSRYDSSSNTDLPRTVFGSRRYDHDNSVMNHRDSNYLPPDRELLAAAKHQFSRPPLNYRPTIRFEKRETLNPDGPKNSYHIVAEGNQPGSCEACTCRHTYFHRN